MAYQAIIIDNDKLSREGLKKLLEKELLFDVIGSECTEPVIDLICSTKPDVIFLDISPPSGNSIQCLEILRKRDETRETPVVVLSSISDRLILANVMQLGITDLIVKPLQRSATMQKLIKIKQSLPPEKVKPLKKIGAETTGRNAGEQPERKVEPGSLQELLEKSKKDIQNTVWKIFRGWTQKQIKLATVKEIPRPEGRIFFQTSISDKKFIKDFDIIFAATEEGIRITASDIKGGILMKLEDGALETFEEMYNQITSELLELFEMKGMKVSAGDTIIKKNMTIEQNDNHLFDTIFLAPRNEFMMLSFVEKQS